MLMESWSDLGRILLVGTLAYVGLVALLRTSGKRTLTKLNAFDFVVTVALGSTLATILLNKSVSLAEGLMAFGLLIFLQFVVTWLSVRFEGFQSFVKASPTLIVYKGRFLDSALRVQRVSREEVLAVLRSNGASDLREVGAVVLETDGSMSVLVDAPEDAGTSTLSTIERA